MEHEERVKQLEDEVQRIGAELGALRADFATFATAVRYFAKHSGASDSVQKALGIPRQKDLWDKRD